MGYQGPLQKRIRQMPYRYEYRPVSEHAVARLQRVLQKHETPRKAGFRKSLV